MYLGLPNSVYTKRSVGILEIVIGFRDPENMGVAVAILFMHVSVPEAGDNFTPHPS